MREVPTHTRTVRGRKQKARVPFVSTPAKWVVNLAVALVIHDTRKKLECKSGQLHMSICAAFTGEDDLRRLANDVSGLGAIN